MSTIILLLHRPAVNSRLRRPPESAGALAALARAFRPLPWLEGSSVVAPDWREVDERRKAHEAPRRRTARAGRRSG